MQYVEFQLEHDKPPRQIRYTITTIRALEENAGCGVGQLLSKAQNVYATVLLLRYGLEWSDASITERRAEKLLQTYIDNGGDIAKLWKAIVKALNRSGVYGKGFDDDEDESTSRPNGLAGAAIGSPEPETTA